MTKVILFLLGFGHSSLLLSYNGINLDDQISLYIDKSGDLEATDVLKKEFSQNKGTTPSYGYKDWAIWTKWRSHNRGLVEVNGGYEIVDIYAISSNGKAATEILRSGYSRPFDNGVLGPLPKIANRNFIGINIGKM